MQNRLRTLQAGKKNWQAQNADAEEDDLLLSDDDTTAAIESAIDTPAETPETTEA